MSPSSQRAWIEIYFGGAPTGFFFVALLAEGVDRNCVLRLQRSMALQSPSSQRAWIEMLLIFRACATQVPCRPPRRGRG